MNSETEQNGKNIGSPSSLPPPVNLEELADSEQKPVLSEVLDENLITLQKVHAILVNCSNLTKEQKLDYANSERFFMKLYLTKLSNKLKDK
jgi:hypothetical protein